MPSVRYVYAAGRENERSDKAWAGWPEQNYVSLCRTGAALHVTTHEWGQPTSLLRKLVTTLVFSDLGTHYIDCGWQSRKKSIEVCTLLIENYVAYDISYMLWGLRILLGSWKFKKSVLALFQRRSRSSPSNDRRRFQSRPRSTHSPQGDLVNFVVGVTQSLQFSVGAISY